MFVRCKLRLSQDRNSVDIVLDRVMGSVLRDGVTFSGKFLSLEGNIPPERRVWRYALTKWELALLDGGGPGVGIIGGGLNYGEVAANLSPSATLSRAVMTSRGIAPSDGSGVGSGSILSGFEISVSFHRGPMKWELVAYQSSGSNAWHEM